MTDKSDPTGRAEGGPRFTVGPWAFNRNQERWFVVDRDGRTVCWTANYENAPIGEIEAKSNIQLIAAAPDLYAALAELVAETERRDNPTDEGLDSDCDQMQRARAALARADGRS